MSESRLLSSNDVLAVPLSDGVRFRLPQRQLRRARHLGWAVVVGGLFATLFMIGWISGPVLDGLGQLEQGDASGWMSIAFGGLGLIGFVPSLGLLLAGISIASNRTRCVVDIRSGKIVVKERFGLFRIRRKHLASKIKRLRIASVDEGLSGEESQSTLAWLGDSDAALMAEGGSGDAFAIAVVYPNELLERLAKELASHLGKDVELALSPVEHDGQTEGFSNLTTQGIEVVKSPEDEESASSVLEQPSDSLVTIERRDYGITIEIPPVGVWKGSKGLFVFAMLWNSFISIFIVVGVLAVAGVIKMDGDGPGWLMLLLIIPFVAVGVGMTIAAVNMGRRHANVATADDLIMIVRHSIFGKTTREWAVSELKEIRCGNSGMEVNNVPVKELQIIPVQGRKFGCLSQLDESDLHWIAAELKQALGI